MKFLSSLTVAGFLAIAALSFGGITPVQAADAAAPAAKAPKPTGFKSTAVTAVDASTVTLAGKTVRVLQVGADAKIKKAGKAATISDIAVGDIVTGSYIKNADGTFTAVTINDKGAAPAKKAAK